MRKVFWSCFWVLPGLSMIAQEVSAQSCGICWGAPGGFHYSAEATEGEDGEGDGWHPNSPEPGDCLFIHGICGGERAGIGAERERLANLVEAAVTAGDWSVVGLLIESSEAVQFSHERGAIQILGCDDTSIFAHVPVPTLAARVDSLTGYDGDRVNVGAD